MGHVGQELGFDPTGLECFFSSEIQLDVLDFDGFQGFPQIFGGLVDVLLHFRLGLAQLFGHGIEAGFQLFELRPGAGVDPGIQLAFLEFGNGLVQFEYRVGERTAQSQGNGHAENDAPENEQQGNKQGLVRLFFGADMGHFHNHPAQRLPQIRHGLAGIRVEHALDHQILQKHGGDKPGAVFSGYPGGVLGGEFVGLHGLRASGPGVEQAGAVTAKEGDGADVLLFQKSIGEAAEQAAIGGKQAIFGTGGELSGE